MILPVLLVITSEHIGHQVVTGKIIGRDLIKDPGLHRSLLGDNFSTIKPVDVATSLTGKVAGLNIQNSPEFNSAPSIDEITVVIHPEWRQECEHILSDCRISKVKHLLDGGKERYHSVLAALKFYAGRPCNLLIHDAVRPLVTRRIIEEVITELQTYKAVNVAIPATDTIIEVDPTHAYVSRIPDRNILYQVQTPQGFHNQTLQEAYALALKDPDFKTTDDCSVVKKYLPQEEIKIVKGEACNMKFTYKEDIIILEQLLKNEGKCYV